MGLFWESGARPSLAGDVCRAGLQSLALSVTAAAHSKIPEPDCPTDELALAIPCVFFFCSYLFRVSTRLCLALVHLLSSRSRVERANCACLSHATQLVVRPLQQSPGSMLHALGVSGGQIAQPDAWLVASVDGSSRSLATWVSARRPESFGTSRGRTLSRYWKLDPSKVYSTSPNAWDTAVHDASEEYKHRMHNLCCDNCHSHVALALNLMKYDNSTSWNMVKLCFFSLLYGKYVSIGGFVKTWLPFVLFLGLIVTVVLTLHLR
ncbi:transmembrane protein 222 isoform X1 [Strix aluco]|uniref:transmembrane protein 222 isoform X1 n=2 Tax=Strix aluco TaxID=111821 RepID=UPI003DA30395